MPIYFENEFLRISYAKIKNMSTTPLVRNFPRDFFYLRSSETEKLKNMSYTNGKESFWQPC